MKVKKELESTTNSCLYTKLYKLYISRKYGYCEYCAFNRGENVRYNYLRRYKKSWKKNSKRRNQYKIKEVAE
jgi:hypothetical protein